MIINLWSTPRTGSVWYSYHLKNLNPSSILLTEPFNRFHMDLYYSTNNGKIINQTHYSEGAFYKDYSILNGKICIQKKYQKRERTIDEEEKYLIDLFNNIDKSLTYIIHNHVSPISEYIFKTLTNLGKNIYIYRKDKLAQLASYAIAYETKEFVRFNKISSENQNLINITNIDSLKTLIERIKVWDNIDKNNIIAYEDITFYDLPGMPKKQNFDYKNQLTKESIRVLENLLSEYYYNN